MNLPERVYICEVGPRDGFQFEEKLIPTDRKIRVIRDLISAGVSRVQVTSFVHPKRVPQMSDAEQVVQGLQGEAQVRLSGLALNERGVQRAADAGLNYVDLSIATNERHGRDNAGMSVEEGVAQADAMIARADTLGLQAQLGFQTVWGYAEPGDTPLEIILRLSERFSDRGLESLSLADSTGMANPDSIRATVEAVRSVTNTPIVLHLHDTRGLGIANVIAAMQAGVDRFDTSLGGLGGCPFIPGATGNVATEDVVYALEQLGVNTGINRRAVGAVSRSMASFLGRELSGKLYALDA